MTDTQSRITIGGIPVDVIRKDIKNLHVGVYPPNGRVRVAVPQRLNDEAVRLAIITKLGWIRRRQEEFNGQERQSRREMVTGESHFVEGRRYRLDVVERNAPASIELKNRGRMTLTVRPGTSSEAREVVLYRWYRKRLMDVLPGLTEKWKDQLGVRPAEVRIKRMKTRWGSCNARVGRVWLNLELAKKPVVCLEYILVHEMLHLIERHHNDRFCELMDTHMPTWRTHRDELNRAPLAHEDWAY